MRSNRHQHLRACVRVRVIAVLIRCSSLLLPHSPTSTHTHTRLRLILASTPLTNPHSPLHFIQPFLGVGATRAIKLFCIMCPVGPYYPEGFNPIKLYADTANVRAWPGGVGNTKVGALFL